MTARKLQDQPWLQAPQTASVMHALSTAGGADCARFVGGCVRNSLLGAPVDDIDIATILKPEAVIAALSAAGLKFVPTGIEHGTITAISEGQPFEITTLRRDVSTDGRRATVAFTLDWAQDAQRRDFTFNALYADAAGDVFDPTGQGLADVAAGRVAFVGQADRRIAEDYLRILRYFRFLAWYGRGEPDAAALAACASGAKGLTQISAERIGKEMLKLLAAPAPAPAVGLMARTGVLALILPAADGLQRFGAVAEASADPLLRLAALLPDDPAAGQQAALALRLSNAQRDRLCSALTPAPALQADMTETDARRAIFGLGRQAFTDRVTLNLAGEMSSVSALLERLRDWTAPALPVGGADALAAGIEPGLQVGLALAAVENWWVAHDFGPDREAALAYLSSMAKGRE